MSTNTSRPSWNDYFIQLAYMVATRSVCLRRKVGAVIVKDKRILSTGYNGPPSKVSHCTEHSCIRTVQNIPSGQKLDICRAIHAEQNAVVQAACHGISIQYADLFCTDIPCLTCAKILIQCGIRNVYYVGDYDDELAKRMFYEGNVKLQQLPIPTNRVQSSQHREERPEPFGILP